MSIRTIAAVLAGLILSSTAAAQTVGWRTDTTGKYPQANPVTTWSADQNVIWKTPTEKWGNALPVIVGEKIFFCEEPDTLVCASKADGKILWRRANPMTSVMTDADKAQAEADKQKADAIRKEIAPLRRQTQTLRKQIGELKQQAGDKPDKEKAAQIDKLSVELGTINKQISSLEAQLKPLTRWEMPPTHGTNGYTSATPVSDGKLVGVVLSTGVVACYDVDGNLKWRKHVDQSPHSWGTCQSPVIAGDKLIVQITTLRALDLATGEQRWECKAANWRWGSPTVARIGQIDVLITAGGDVIRLSDGQVLAGKLAQLEYNAPLFENGVAYFIQSGGKAVRLSPKGDDGVEAKELWKTQPKKDRYYGSPVLHDGKIYACTQAGVFSVIDAANGTVVKEITLPLGKGTAYPSIVLAGRMLLVSSDNGTTVVLDTGDDLKQVASNSLGETFRSTPVFDASRMYIRGYKNLFCIGK